MGSHKSRVEGENHIPQLVWVSLWCNIESKLISLCHLKWQFLKLAEMCALSSIVRQSKECSDSMSLCSCCQWGGRGLDIRCSLLSRSVESSKFPYFLRFWEANVKAFTLGFRWGSRGSISFHPPQTELFYSFITLGNKNIMTWLFIGLHQVAQALCLLGFVFSSPHHWNFWLRVLLSAVLYWSIHTTEA